MGADVLLTDSRGEDYSLVVTYNLSGLLAAAGFGRWVEHLGDTPAEFGSHLARLRDVLRSDLEHWSTFDAPNGWGTAAGLLEAVDVLCRQVPWEDPGLTWAVSL